MTPTTDQKNRVNPVEGYNPFGPSAQLPQEKGGLQGRRIINTTEKVKALRDEFERTNLSKIGRIGYTVLGVAVAVTAIVATVLALATLSPLAIPAAIGVSLGGCVLGAKIAFVAVDRNHDGKIAATKNQAFINWAEERGYELDADNISSHFLNYRKGMEKLREEMRLREIASYPPELRAQLHELEMMQKRSTWPGTHLGLGVI